MVKSIKRESRRMAAGSSGEEGIMSPWFQLGKTESSGDGGNGCMTV